MSKMPPTAKVYLVLTVITGFLSLCLSQTKFFPSFPHTAWDTACMALLALMFGGQKLSLNRLRKQEAAISMTLGFALMFAALLRLGASAAVPVSMLCCLSSCIYPKVQKARQIAFNIGLSAFEAVLTSMFFYGINGIGAELDPARVFVAVTACCFVLFVVNTVGVALMISLHTNERLATIWKDNFLWTVPGYLASACIGAMSVLLFKGNTGAILLFCAPIAYIAFQWFATNTERAAENRKHIVELEAKQAELERVYISTIESLALAIDAKDRYTHQHIVRVQRYAVAIAQQLGLRGGDLEGVRTGALLHDIGKLGVSEYVLLKPSPLTGDEYEQIKRHPEIGAAILDPVAFPWPVLPAVKHHHERWDGSGYPSGLAGEAIPLPARIMAVADVYDALTSTRAYRTAWPHEDAVRLIRDGAGSQFDPVVVSAFLAIIDRVVREMALDGWGPLAVRSERPDKLHRLYEGLPMECSNPPRVAGAELVDHETESLVALVEAKNGESVKKAHLR